METRKEQDELFAEYEPAADVDNPRANPIIVGNPGLDPIIVDNPRVDPIIVENSRLPAPKDTALLFPLLFRARLGICDIINIGLGYHTDSTDRLSSTLLISALK